MSFDPRIQVQASFVKRSLLSVSIAPYELREPLAIRVGMQKHWRKLPPDGVYACEVLLQLILDTQSGEQAAVVEAVLDQICLVQGYEGQALSDVLELQMPAIALPYARAQIAALLLQSGYHYITLPANLPGADLRAVQSTEDVPQQAEEVSP